MSSRQFIECPACAAKPGSPALCEACRANRKLIGDLIADDEESDGEWNAIVGREFFRGWRNGAITGFAVGLALAWWMLG